MRRRNKKGPFDLTRFLFHLSEPGPAASLAWIGAGWAVAFFAVLALLNFHPIVKTELTTVRPLGPIGFMFTAGMAAMIFGFRRLPTKEPRDMGRTQAWAWFGILMATGVFLRLYNLGNPPGAFWDDWATNLIWVRHILDKDRFFWMMPTDGIEPFVPYVITAIQALLPDEVKDFTTRRIASCLIDMAALWVLYLTGKELGSRRAGLVAMALAALGRPMVQLSVTGMRAYSLGLAVSLLILMTLKLLRKPSRLHYFLWSFALAFGVHTYSSYRTFMLIVPFLLLPWALGEWKKNPIRLEEWLAVLGAVFLLLGVYSGTFAVTSPLFSGWSKTWEGWAAQPWLITGIFTLGSAPAVFAAWRDRDKATVTRLTGWSLALGCSCLMIFPLSHSEGFNGRMAVLSPFHQQTQTPHPWVYLSGKVWETLRSLFYFCLDRNDLQIATDPFYDVYSQGALLLGFAFLAARPGWKKVFLLILAAIGTLVYVISFDPASTKLVASAPPLYLLAGWAVSRLWSGFSPSPPKYRFSLPAVLLALLLAGYAAWGGWIQHRKIFGVWAPAFLNDRSVARQIWIDEPGFRVYLARSDWFFGLNAQFVLNEGKRYYLLKDTNVIPLGPGEKAEDMVALVFGSDIKTIEALHHQFPSALWEKVFVIPHTGSDPNPEHYMWRVLIPGTSLSTDPKAVLYRREETGPWTRRYFYALYGWGLSGILKEERVLSLSTPAPEERLLSVTFNDYDHARLAQVTGTFQVDVDGRYEWSIGSSNAIWFRIDGRTVWKRDFYEKDSAARKRVHLSAGTHRLEMRVRFKNDYALPQVRWKRVGDDIERPL